MIPLRDEIPNRRPALVTIGLMAANIAVWLFSLTLGRQAEAVFTYVLGAVPTFILGQAPPELPLPPLASLLTYQFLHGDVWHLAGNMLYLWIFGSSLEDAMGRGRFLAFYLLGGVLAGLAHVLTNPSSDLPMIGASGAVAAVLGGYMTLFPRRNVLVLIWLIFYIQIIKAPAVIFLGLWFFFQVLGMGGAETAWMAHIGGFVAGLALVRRFMPRLGRPAPGPPAGQGPPTIH